MPMPSPSCPTPGASPRRNSPADRTNPRAPVIGRDLTANHTDDSKSESRVRGPESRAQSPEPRVQIRNSHDRRSGPRALDSGLGEPEPSPSPKSGVQSPDQKQS